MSLASVLSLSSIKALVARIDREFEGVELVDRAAQRTGISRGYLVIAAGSLLFFFLFVGFGAGFFSHLVGFAYPAYASFKVIESKDVRDDAQWLTYWVIFALFSLVEPFSDILLWWFPFYYSVKIMALLFCQLPQFNGAQYVYIHYAKPWFERTAPFIESQVATVGGIGTRIVNETVADMAPRAAPPPSTRAGLLPVHELFTDSATGSGISPTAGKAGKAQ